MSSQEALSMLLMALAGASGGDAGKSSKIDNCQHHFHPPKTCSMIASSEALECCKCLGTITVPCTIVDALESGLKLVLNGGYRFQQPSLAILAEASSLLHKLSKVYLKPIIDQKLPPNWKTVGFPFIKYTSEKLQKVFGSEERGCWTLLIACGFKKSLDDNGAIEMKDWNDESKREYVKQCYDTILKVADDVLHTRVNPIVERSCFYEVYSQSTLIKYEFDTRFGGLNRKTSVVNADDLPKLQQLRADLLEVGAFANKCKKYLMSNAQAVRTIEQAQKDLERAVDAVYDYTAFVLLKLKPDTPVVPSAAAVEQAELLKKLKDAGSDSKKRVADRKRKQRLRDAMQEDQDMLEAIKRSEDELLWTQQIAAMQDGALGLKDSLESENGGAPVGLLNTAVSCHANSLLQAMFALTPLRRDIVLAARNIDSQNEPEQADDNDEMRAARQRSETCLKKLGELFTRMGMSRLPVSTQSFLETLLEGTPLKSNQQHDVTEIKDLFLSRLEPCLPMLSKTFYGTLNFTPAVLAARARQARNTSNPSTVSILQASAGGGLLTRPPRDDSDLLALDAADKQLSSSSSSNATSSTKQVVPQDKFSDVILHPRGDGTSSDSVADALQRALIGAEDEADDAIAAHQLQAIARAPPLLTLAIQRVRFDRIANRATKVRTTLSFKQQLSLRQYTESDDADTPTASALRKWTRRRRRRIAELDNAVEQIKRVAGGETSLQTMTNHVQQYANAIGDSQLGNQLYELNLKMNKDVEEWTKRAQTLRDEVESRYAALSDDNGEYALHAVLVHHGDHAEYGHYYAFVRHAETWYQCNDSSVTPVDWEKVESVGVNDAYCLMYMSREYKQEHDKLLRDCDFAFEVYDPSVITELLDGENKLRRSLGALNNNNDNDNDNDDNKDKETSVIDLTQ